jgi:ankyrin repeat protein
MIITRCLLALRSLPSLCFVVAFILQFFLSVSEAMEDIDKISASLITAVEERDISKARELISKGADVNYSPDDFPTPLLTAVALGDLEMVKLLVKNKADLDFSPENLPTPLYLAVTLDEYDIVKLLIDKGADPNKKSPVLQYNEINHMHPLYPALFVSDNIFKLILKKSSNRGGNQSDFSNILELAVRIDEFDKVKLLIDRGVPITEDALLIAVKYGSDQKIIDYLLKKGAKISDDFVKYYCDSLEELRFCLNNGVKPEDIVKHNSGVLTDYEKLEFLLDNGLSPNIQVSHNDFPGIVIVYDNSSDDLKLSFDQITYDTVPLILILNMGRFSSTELVLERGADPNVTLPGGESSWMYVLIFKDTVYAAQKAELLERYGALKGFRPLFEAQGKLDLYEKWKSTYQEYEEGYLAKRTSLPSSTTETKEKQVIEMVYGNDINAIKQAVADGVDFNFTDDFENTPLLAAISKKDTAMVSLLLENGADPNFWGFITPLMGAVRANDVETAKLLIEKGAVFNGGDYLTYAMILKKPEIRDLLLKYEYDLNEALFASVVVRDVSLSREMLNKGADPNMVRFGSPLITLNEHFDAVGENISAKHGIFNLLLNKKASLDVYDSLLLRGLNLNDGIISLTREHPTPILTNYLLTMSIKRMKLILEKGANPNILNNGGETPIMFAIFYINCDYNAIIGINYLIKNGADPSIKANNNYSAYDLLDKPSIIKDNKCSMPPSMQKIVRLILDNGKKL